MSERVEVTIEKLVHGGSGLARLASGHSLFLPGVLPGERVSAEVTRKRKGVYEGRLVAVLEASEDRIDPPCSGEIECTGATWKHIAYPAQLRLKQEILLDALRRIAGLHPARLLTALPSPSLDHYRLRTQFNVRTAGGRSQIGFFRQGTCDLVEVCNPFLVHPAINRTLEAIRKRAAMLPPLREIHINAGSGGEVHALLLGDQPSMPPQHALFSAIQEEAPELAGMAGFGRRKKLFSLGRNYLVLENDGLVFHATEGNFFQINWGQNSNMVKTVLSFAGLLGNETVLDLYCGIGNFTLPLARYARVVIGVESGFSAVDDARENARRNNIHNVEFLADDLQQGLKSLMTRKLRAGVVVLDPPRAGATLTTLERVLAFVPRRIVYVSCNPPTLARDLKFFALFGFRLDRLQLIDMFPWTYHIECVAEMVRED